MPALIVTGGGPPPYATTYVPLFVYRNAFEYLRYGYAAAATLTMFAITALIVYVQYRIVKLYRHEFSLYYRFYVFCVPLPQFPVQIWRHRVIAV